MGCGKPNTIIKNYQDSFIYKVNIKNEVKQTYDTYSYKSKHPAISLTVLMNYLCFNLNQEKQLDGNFISIHNKEKDIFAYHIQRLDGVTMSNESNPREGKNWIVHINNSKRYEWNDVVNNNLEVSYNDQIEWVFQHPVEIS